MSSLNPSQFETAYYAAMCVLTLLGILLVWKGK